MMIRWRSLLVCAFLVLPLAACGDDDSATDTGGDDAATDTPGETPTDTPVETPTDTPVETPTDTPVDTPTDTPVDTPTDTPVDTPTDTPATACESYCGPVVAAGCPGGPTSIDDCLGGCAAILTECPDAFADLVTCAGASPVLACDASGMPTVTGCEAEYAALMGCMAGGPCGGYCAQAVVAECDLAPDTFAECTANCFGSAMACSTEFGALSTCAGDTFTVGCDSLGRVAITGCETEYADLMQCSVTDPCTEMCGPTVEEDCASGPPTVPACVDGCTGVAGNGCIQELTELAECAGTDPTIVCNASDMPVVEGCETENAAYIACGGG